jgi:glycosyltransferase involved in cell wall biosynthesis
MMQNEKPKRVLMVVENCPFLRDPRVQKEAKALTAAGYRVTVICPAENDEPRHDFIGDTSVYQFPVWPLTEGSLGYLLEYCYAMMALVVLSVWVWLHEGFNIIHVANPPDCMVPLFSVYRLIGKSVIYDQHDLCPELHAAKFGENRWLLRLLLLMERYSCRLANQVIVTNESYKELSIRRGGVSASDVTVVRNGPDLQTVKPETSVIDIDQELRSKSSNIIAFAGVTGVQDGLDCLCRALHHLRYELGQENFYCIILGDGDGLSPMKALAEELRVADKIWFAGWVRDPVAYARYINTSDICVSPDPFNSYNDASTFVKIMEYMAAGKPVVAFDLQETRTSAGNAALYARVGDVGDFAQKIASLLGQPELRDRMGQIGIVRVQKELAWQYSIPKLLQVYERIGQPRLEAGPAPAYQKHSN